ncbi:MAG: hypothetical protein OEW68_00655 [Gammaproteobacteria bacterium]|nr:hypothetical protein [Gammaproteobacteria bacterium]MDH4313334.1 hypothetical protein [Gammaproteobacteria bacterium]MDH5214021.1 hypothetical protein [Gammaproteobacteria bacterium]MDH5499967.1 hypothetical protein [Gammaproteobacteria bacterium]
MCTFDRSWRLAGALILLAAGNAVLADSRVNQVWTCTLNEGHVVADMRAAQAAWVSWANKKPHGKDLRGSVATPMVSSDLSVVMYVDSYPNLEVYAADVRAYDSDEGRALQKAFDKVSTCTSAAM